MRIIEDKYRKVNELPENALTIGEYANQKGITKGHVYTHFSRGRADYEIVEFRTFLFVVPLAVSAN